MRERLRVVLCPRRESDPASGHLGGPKAAIQGKGKGKWREANGRRQLETAIKPGVMPAPPPQPLGGSAALCPSPPVRVENLFALTCPQIVGLVGHLAQVLRKTAVVMGTGFREI